MRATGDNRVVSAIQGRAARLMVVAVLAVGLVGMHHLVVAACHHVGQAGAHHGVLTMDAAPAVTTYDVPIGAHHEAPVEGSGGLIGAAATCLAVLLMIVGLVIPQVLSRLRRWQALRFAMTVPPASTCPPKPPDLTVLSVSRT
jgi:hypothetical protein